MERVRFINFPKILDERGNLSVVENGAALPFEIAGCAWLYDLRDGEKWQNKHLGGTDELIIALSGGFEITVNDETDSKSFYLNRPYRALYVPKGLQWQMGNFTTNSVVFVLSAEKGVNGGESAADGSFGNKVVPLNEAPCLQGHITVVENGKDSPFDVKRVYYLYDVPAGESRGAHAHRALKQLVIAVSGSFNITLDDGKEKHLYTLNRPGEALEVGPGMWRTLDGFSSGAICLVLASEVYTAEDYIRDYDEFLEYKKQKQI